MRGTRETPPREHSKKTGVVVNMVLAATPPLPMSPVAPNTAPVERDTIEPKPFAEGERETPKGVDAVADGGRSVTG